ncbi:hypothetical protein D3C74_475440 [compost metagenome]
MATTSIHCAVAEILPKLLETSPNPGPTLVKAAATAVNAVTSFNPVISNNSMKMKNSMM